MHTECQMPVLVNTCKCLSNNVFAQYFTCLVALNSHYVILSCDHFFAFPLDHYIYMLVVRLKSADEKIRQIHVPVFNEKWQKFKLAKMVQSFHKSLLNSLHVGLFCLLFCRLLFFFLTYKFFN